MLQIYGEGTVPASEAMGMVYKQRVRRFCTETTPKDHVLNVGDKCFSVDE